MIERLEKGEKNKVKKSDIKPKVLPKNQSKNQSKDDKSEISLKDAKELKKNTSGSPLKKNTNLTKQE